MSPEELIQAGNEVFGARWVRPLARKLDRSPRLVRWWRDGQRRITDDAVREIRSLHDIGPIGCAIRSALKRTVPGISAWDAHRAAIETVAQLQRVDQSMTGRS